MMRDDATGSSPGFISERQQSSDAPSPTDDDESLPATRSSAQLAALTDSCCNTAAEPAALEQPKKSPNDFIFVKHIGEGSFSTVFKCKEVDTGREFAIKVCEKRLIRKEKKIAYVMREKDVMAILTKNHHPFFVTLYCTFQDKERLYFVMTLAKNGELLEHMNRLGSFDEDVTRFYTAEIVLALEHLHKLGVIHRDLKPENVLLNEDMHILISDFGSAKLLNRDEDRPTPLLPQASQAVKPRSSFVGTAQYVSPEILNGKPATFSCDFWAVGCMVYQMLSGLPPFRGANEYLIFQKIIKLEYSFPDGFPEVPRDLVKHLLLLEAEDRLGDESKGGVRSLREHQFFSGINWQNLPQEKPPEIVPYLPATHGSQSYHGNYKKSSQDIQPGLDDKQMMRLLTLQLDKDTTRFHANPSKPQHILDISKSERDKRLLIQHKENPYHRFVEGNLILKSGLLDKRKGLFARRRMFLLTEGPHLYYVDPANMELKGEVPWSKGMRLEPKNFKIFFVHTPNRTYYLEDPTGRCLEWCDALEQVRRFYFDLVPTKSPEKSDGNPTKRPTVSATTAATKVT